MPRVYKKKVNSRYASFSVESMNSTIADVRANIMSVKKAAFKYGLNRSTLIYRLKNAHTDSVGKPSILTRDEESVVAISREFWHMTSSTQQVETSDTTTSMAALVLIKQWIARVETF
jgi:G:T-mismatch repair DNA endonuclease (very short patch repair protein)